MSSNKRVFWACTAISFCTHGTVLGVGAGGNGPVDTTGCNVAYGVQSVGITTNFNLEQIFELGQIAIYENVEEVPDIEISVEKVLDGKALLYDLATDFSVAAPATLGNNVSMVGMAQDRKDVWFTVQSEITDQVQSQGALVYCSGMYVSSFSYTLPNEGSCTESLTLVGNDKLWTDPGGGGAAGNAIDPRMNVHTMGDWSLADFGSDSPAVGIGGVQRRENVMLGTSWLPRDIFGIAAVAAVGNAEKADVHLISITMSGDLGREAINELGTKLPYYRYVTFPVEVSTDIEVTTISGDLVDAGSHKDNLIDEKIFIILQDSTAFDLGTKNKLQSVTYTGASTGGENASCTYSYLGFNEFNVNGPANP
jgi:hypothetical protein